MVPMPNPKSPTEPVPAAVVDSEPTLAPVVTQANADATFVTPSPFAGPLPTTPAESISPSPFAPHPVVTGETHFTPAPAQEDPPPATWRQVPETPVAYKPPTPQSGEGAPFVAATAPLVSVGAPAPGAEPAQVVFASSFPVDNLQRQEVTERTLVEELAPNPEVTPAPTTMPEWSLPPITGLAGPTEITAVGLPPPSPELATSGDNTQIAPLPEGAGAPLAPIEVTAPDVAMAAAVSLSEAPTPVETIEDALPIEPAESLEEALPLEEAEAMPAPAAPTTAAELDASMPPPAEASALSVPRGVTMDLSEDELPKSSKRPLLFAATALVVVAAGVGGAAWYLGYLPFGSRAGTEPTAAVAAADPVAVPTPTVVPTPTEEKPAEAATATTESPGDPPAAGADAKPEAATALPGTEKTEAAVTPTEASTEEPTAIEEPKGKKDRKKTSKKTSKATVTSKSSKTSKSAKAPPEPAAKAGAADAAEEHYKKANDLIKDKKIPSAIDELGKALAANPKHAKSYRLLGMAQTLQGKEKSAVEAFEKFLKLDPGHKDAPKIKAIIDDYRKRNPK